VLTLFGGDPGAQQLADLRVVRAAQQPPGVEEALIVDEVDQYAGQRQVPPGAGGAAKAGEPEHQSGHEARVARQQPEAAAGVDADEGRHVVHALLAARVLQVQRGAAHAGAAAMAPRM
jgi:hypothetical protein